MKKAEVGKDKTMSAVREVHHEVVHFAGLVQGVGFRYTTLQIAREYEVAGFVQNLPDGRVRVEVEGERGEVERFVLSLQERMQGYVHKVDRVAGRRPPQFSGFSIR